MRNPRTGWLLLLVAGSLAGSFLGCNRQRRLAEVSHSEANVEAIARADQIASLGIAWQAEEESEAGLFEDDRGERLLAKLLPPSESSPGLTNDKRSTRVPFRPSSTLEVLSPRLPLAQTELPKVKTRSEGSKKLTALPPEGMPLAFSRAEPVVPDRGELPASERARVPSPRLDGPLPLPPLATRYQEPISIDDLTGEYSLAAALATPPPSRTSQAPFLRLTIPDPFEHRPAARLRSELEESPSPMTSSPRPPR